MAAIKSSCSLASSASSSSRLACSSGRPLRALTSRPRVVRAAAAAKLPQGVTAPPRLPEVPAPKYGFVDNAEVKNSRAAMIGFFALLLVEGVSGKGLLELVGLQIGKGLGFEF